VLVSTAIGATPEVAPRRQVTCSASTLRRLKFWIVSLPNVSSPTFETITTSQPKMAACTAWLAPLPPNPEANFEPTSVSPVAGIRGT